MGESYASAPKLLIRSQLEKVSACLLVAIIDACKEKKIQSWTEGCLCSLDYCV
jgi:hypothetical protein